jgi:hypothetical protein
MPKALLRVARVKLQALEINAKAFGPKHILKIYQQPTIAVLRRCAGRCPDSALAGRGFSTVLHWASVGEVVGIDSEEQVTEAPLFPFWLSALC